LTHDLGKGITPPEEWPRHIDHEAKGVPLVAELCQRLRVPREFRELAELVARYHLHFHRAHELRAGTILKLIQSLDGFRRPERFDMFLLACEADARGRPGYEDREMDQPVILRAAYAAANSISVQDIVALGLKGDAIADELQQRRIKVIKKIRNETDEPDSV